MNERGRVLVVDDDVVSRMMLMHLVDTGGHYEIHEAADGANAWRELEAGLLPAIIFCDLRMPFVSGMELLERVKADPRFAAIPFVLASAANERETVDQAGVLGASGYLVKPFRAQEVHALLAALAGTRQHDEAPAMTAARLSIDVNRLLLYLGGLHKQLADARVEIEQMLAMADVEAARARIARLREGCETLGLASAAQAIGCLLAQPAITLADTEEALRIASHAALRQGDLARALAAG